MESTPGGQEATMVDDLEDLYGDDSVTTEPALGRPVENTEATEPQTQNNKNANIQLAGSSKEHPTEVKTTSEVRAQSDAEAGVDSQASSHTVTVPPEAPGNLPSAGEMVTDPSLLDGKDREVKVKDPSIDGAASSLPADVLDNERVEGDQAEWEVDSSPYESSSDDSSDTSSSGSESGYELLDPAEQARRLMEGDGNSDNEGGLKETKGSAIKSHNEQTDEPVIKPDVAVTEDMKTIVLGKVQTIVDSIVLIKANTSGEYEVLESGSLLCLKSRDVIGVVAETLGPVQQPLYSVRFNNVPEIVDAGIEVGTTLYYVPEHSSYVFTKALQAVKGSDASNIHDEEVGADEIEFSDDEAEMAYKRSLKAEKRDRRLNNSGQRTNGFSRARDGDGPETPSYINYDDEPQDELYTPLTRPSNLHEMMHQNNGPARGSSTGNRGARGRGDRRGDRGRHRGRGDRARGSGQRDQYASIPRPHHDFSPTAAANGPPPPPPPFAYNPSTPGMQPPSSPHGASAPFTGTHPYPFQPPGPGAPPFNQGYQQHYAAPQYPTAPPHWPPQQFGQQQFGQQHFGQPGQYPPPPPPPPPPPGQFGYGPGTPSSPQYPQGAAINPRFFQPPPPHNPQQQQQQQQQQHGR